MARKSFVQINGVLYDKSLPLPEGVAGPQEAVPSVLPDLPEFRSPIDGKVYSGRAGLRDHCARHNVVPNNELKGLPIKTAISEYKPDRAAIREILRQKIYGNSNKKEGRPQAVLG